MLKVIDLFSGIGGFSLGLERAKGFKTVAFCEIDPFCQRLLNKRWPSVPIFNDIKDFNYEGSADLICGGYPCQPFSVAGKRKGQKDDRHLWPQMFKIIQKYRPNWVIGENVAGHVNMGLDDVLLDLENEGYSARAFVIPACAVQAVHRRDRVWIVAYSSGKRCSGGREKQRNDDKKWQSGKNQQDNKNKVRTQASPCVERISSKTADNGLLGIQGGRKKALQGFEGLSWCQNIRRFEDYFTRPNVPKPLVCRMDDGVPKGVDGLGGRKQRLKGLGNAIVPQIAEIIGLAILESINQS